MGSAIAKLFTQCGPQDSKKEQQRKASVQAAAEFLTKYAEDRRSATIEIPSKYHSLLIGSGGCVAKELRKETGVSFEVPKQGAESDTVKVGPGEPESVDKLVQRIKGIAGDAIAAEEAREAEHQAVHDATSALFDKYRAQLDELHDKRKDLSTRSQQSFTDGDKAEAKRLSDEAKAVLVEIGKVEKQASDDVFQSRNKGHGNECIDLHGLYLEPALERLAAHLDAAQAAGIKQTEVIYGAGSHSGDAGPKIKPACLKEFQTRKLRWEEVNHGSATVFF